MKKKGIHAIVRYLNHDSNKIYWIPVKVSPSGEGLEVRSGNKLKREQNSVFLSVGFNCQEQINK